MKPLIATLAALAITPAFATTIDFEAVTSFASIGDLYAADGVTFGPDAIGLVNDEFTTFFSNAPSPVGVLALAGTDATLNVAAGFTGAISFWYSSPVDIPGALILWSGPDGTGTALGSLDLAANSSGAYDGWTQVSGFLPVTAHSVTFGTDAVLAAYDDVNISVVPEPASALLMALGVIGLAGAIRRRG